MTPLSSLKNLESLPSTPFDFSQIPPQASAQDIRELLAGQIQKQSQQNEYRDVKQLMALKSLKNLKFNNRHPIPQESDPNTIDWSSLAETVRKLIASRKSEEKTTTAPPIITTTESPVKQKKETPPQVYIQFIELPSRAVEALLGKHQPANQTYAPEPVQHVFQESRKDHHHHYPAKDTLEYSRKHYDQNYGTQNFIPQQQHGHSTPAYPNNRYPYHHPQGPSNNNYIMPAISPLPPPTPENEDNLHAPSPPVSEMQ